MRTPSILPALTVLAASAALPHDAHPQEQEVRAAIEQQMAAWTSGDIEVFGGFYAAETRGFNIDGGMLAMGFNPQMVQAALQAGFVIEFVPRDIDVKVHGETAVAAGYLDGSITIPGGEPQKGTWRYSETRVKIDGVWKVVQYHFSELRLPTGRGARE